MIINTWLLTSEYNPWLLTQSLQYFIILNLRGQPRRRAGLGCGGSSEHTGQRRHAPLLYPPSPATWMCRRRPADAEPAQDRVTRMTWTRPGRGPFSPGRLPGQWALAQANAVDRRTRLPRAGGGIRQGDQIPRQNVSGQSALHSRAHPHRRCRKTAWMQSLRASRQGVCVRGRGRDRRLQNVSQQSQLLSLPAGRNALILLFRK